MGVSIRSEIELNNLHSKLTPYMTNGKKEIFPTSGDGRRKLLAYTLLTLENRRMEEQKINIFLIEELENHLHRSMQIGLSYQLFSDEIFKYFIMTTHSSLIIREMDNVNLIKLSKEKKLIGKSYCYKVPAEYESLKQKLNQNLAEAIFAETVLLVEGPSEKVLFERILRDKCGKYESLGGYILEVDGINFLEYFKVLNGLGIRIIVKTDNDLKLYEDKKECNLLGLNRALTLGGMNTTTNIKNIETDKYTKELEYKRNIQRNIYTVKYKTKIQQLRKKNIYLSKIDLENDLYEVIPEGIDTFVSSISRTKKHPIIFMQDAKMINMIDLCRLLTIKEIELIYNSDLFSCIKELAISCNQ